MLATIGLNTNRNGEEIGNMSPLDFQCSPGFHESTKHIELECNFVREKIQSKMVFPFYIRSFEQITNIFTKPLVLLFHCLISKLGVTYVHASP